MTNRIIQTSNLDYKNQSHNLVTILPKQTNKQTKKQPSYFPPDHMWSNFQFSSVAQSCPTLCDPMNCSMPGFPVHHHLPEFTQTHVHRVGDAIQLSHPLSSPSPPAPNPSQHQGLFQWVNSSHEVSKVLELQLQHQFFPWSNSRLFKIAKKKKKKIHSQHVTTEEMQKVKCRLWKQFKEELPKMFWAMAHSL